MSADNGVYVAKFRDAYRVAYAHAIENCNYYEPGTKEWFTELQTYFGGAPAYKTRDAAMKKGWELSLEISQDGPLEYGLSYLGEFDIDLSKTWEEQCGITKSGKQKKRIR